MSQSIIAFHVAERVSRTSSSYGYACVLKPVDAIRVVHHIQKVTETMGLGQIANVDANWLAA